MIQPSDGVPKDAWAMGETARVVGAETASPQHPIPRAPFGGRSAAAGPEPTRQVPVNGGVSAVGDEYLDKQRGPVGCGASLA